MNVETQTGYLDGIELELVDLADHFESAIVRYEYPYVDGADLENLGQKAGTVKVRCYFWDNAAQSTYNDHITLLNKLKGGGDHELLHPKYGIMRGMVESVDTRHDDRLRTAEVDFSFVKQGLNAIEASSSDAVDGALEGAFSASLDQQGIELAADLAEVGLDIDREFDPGQGLLAQLAWSTPSARSFIRQLDAGLARLSAYADEVTQPINSLTATLSYAANLPGRILGIVDRCLERVARLHDGLARFPARFHASLAFGLAKVATDLDSLLPADRVGAKTVLMKHLQLAASRRLALETGYLYAADQDARRLQQAQPASVFDALGRYTPPALLDVQPMNVLELEETLATTRTLLQAGVNAARSMQTLKEMAQALVDSASRVKQGTEQVVTVQVDGATPLQVICLRYGLPYSDAARIMALNPGLRNPSFASGQFLVYRGAA